MLKLLKEDKILGDDVAQLVDMSFIKSPEKNPELIMDCFILALDQLGYRLGFELLEDALCGISLETRLMA